MSEANLNLQDLIKKCKKGSEAHLNQLYDMYCNMIMGICLRYANNRELAEDMFQESFLKIFSNIKKVKGPTTFSGWIKRIAINTCIDHAKQNAKLFTLQINLEQEEEVTDDSYLEIVDNMSTDQLVKLITNLPAGYRIVLNMYVVEGYTHKEIAEKLGISESTSRSQLTYAKKSLRKKLENHGIINYESII